MKSKRIDDKTSGGQGGPHRKRRRWLRRLMGLVAVLLILVALSPYILSAGPVTRFVVSTYNGGIQGQVHVGSLSLSWTGPCRIENLSVTDADGKEVLRAASVTVPGGLWHFIQSAEQFERVEIESARIELRRTAAGTISLFDAFAPRKPAAAEPPGEPAPAPAPPPEPRQARKPKPLPRPTGRIVLRDALVRLVQPDGAQYEVSKINAEFGIDTLNDLTGSIRARTPESGSLSVEFKVTGMAGKTEFKPQQGSGFVEVKTEDDIALAPLGRFVGSPAPLAGTVRATKLYAGLSPGEAHCLLDISVFGLRSGDERYRHLRPVDLRLGGNIDVAGPKAAGKVSFTGPKIGLDATFAHVGGAGPIQWTASDLIAAALEGKPVSLPEFTAKVSGKIDLPTLAQAIPALLRIRPDVAVQSGSLDVKDVIVQGGDQPEAKGTVSLADVKTARDGRTTTWKTVTAAFDASLAPGKGLQIKDTSVTTGFADLTAEGSRSKVKITYKADLANLASQLDEVFQIGTLGLAGKSAGSVELVPTAEGQAGILFDVSVNSLHYEKDDRKLDVATAALAGRGELTWKGRSARIAAASYELKADDFLAVRGSGSFEVPSGTLHADVEIVKAVLEKLLGKARGIAGTVPEGYSGQIAGVARIDRVSSKAPLACSGWLAAGDLCRYGKPVSAKDVRLEWDRLELTPAERRMTLAAAKFTSGPAQGTVVNVAASFGKEPAAGGEATVTADLAACLETFRNLSPPAADGAQKPPALAGLLTWTGTARSGAGRIALAGNGRVEKFVVHTSKGDIRQGEVRFEQAVEVDPEAEVITFRKMVLNSEPLTVTVDDGSTIRQYSSEKVLNVTGSYTGDWERLLAILQQLQPKVAEKVSATGTTGGKFRVAGPADRAGAKPAFRDLEAHTTLEWASANVEGLALGKARFEPVLKDGQLIVPLTEVPASGGTVRIGATVDLRPKDKIVHIYRDTVVVDKVRIDRKVAQEMLSRFNPIFAKLAAIQGQVSLTTKEPIQLAVTPDGIADGSGSGVLDLGSLDIQPDGLLAGLLSLAGMPADQAQMVQIGDVDFAVRGNRIAYDNFTIRFGKDFDLRFHGSVGFDETLEMAVSMPINLAFVQKLNVSSSLLGFAKKLEGLRVDVPITGMRLNPKFSLPNAEVERLLKEAAGKMLFEKVEKGVGGELEDILKKKLPQIEPKPAPVPKPKPQPQPKPRPKSEDRQPREKAPDAAPAVTPEEMLRQGIFEVLRKISEQKQPPTE